MSIHTILSQMEEELNQTFRVTESGVIETVDLRGNILHKNWQRVSDLGWFKSFFRSFATRIVEEVKESERWESTCGDHTHPSFWKTVVESPQWKDWYKEQGKRLHELAQTKNKKIEVFDIDESQECGWMSPEHFQSFIKFIVSRTKLQKMKGEYGTSK